MINACLGPYADSLKPDDYKLIIQEQIHLYGVRKKNLAPSWPQSHGDCRLN
ncbi:hypothetical protein K8942_00800 [Candidatus Peribacteria bacterium]|nr:MAG: hypothetical protein K8942_00800 [Candidatus Peribacteria bacterium]